MEEIVRIRDTAQFSVGRACLFAMLGIWAAVGGLIGWPVMAFRTGAVLSALGCAVLLVKAEQARKRSYRRSEVWILLGRRHGLPEPRAQEIIAGVLSETFERFAWYSGAVAVIFWLCAGTAWLLTR